MITAEEHTRRMELYRQRLNDVQMGRALGCSHANVAYWRKKNGLKSIAPHPPGGGNKKRYSVWDNRTDQIVCCDMTADECARIMGVKYFHSTKYHNAGKWTILECEDDDDDQS